ncbi:MAG: hypothetical protein LBS98_07230 [Coriobacteriales bacterium]|nr:hypothetical protein [Coriobacteriales bacterium]
MHRFAVVGSKDGEYIVSFDGNRICEGLSMPKAAQCVTQIISDSFCTWVDGGVCVMHAAGALHGGGIVLFSGVSGSGKTSLALEFSKYGAFVGDECAFLDANKGTVWYEEFPFQLKANNEALLSRFSRHQSLEVYSELYGAVFYLPLDAVAFQPMKREDDAAVRVIVFPHYCCEAEAMRIRKLPPTALPKHILSSLMGA